MARENKTKYALLGLLSWGPMSGYDIKKNIEASLGNFWQEGYGQIYPMLKRLTTDALAARSVKRQEGKPDRHVYTITDQGLDALQQWLTEPVEYQPGRNELLLKLFFGRRTEREGLIAHVQAYQQRCQTLQQKYAGIETHLRATCEHETHSELPYWLMTLSFGKHESEARLRWCEETLAMLQELADSHEPSAR